MREPLPDYKLSADTMPLSEFPGVPAEKALPLLEATLTFALCSPGGSLAQLDQCSRDNQASIALLRARAPERFARLQAKVQALRHQLLAQEIAGAGTAAALERMAATCKKSFDTLGRTEPALLQQLREAYRTKLAALRSAAAA
jgi:hypothetical protein